MSSNLATTSATVTFLKALSIWLSKLDAAGEAWPSPASGISSSVTSRGSSVAGASGFSAAGGAKAGGFLSGGGASVIGTSSNAAGGTPGPGTGGAAWASVTINSSSESLTSKSSSTEVVSIPAFILSIKPLIEGACGFS